MNEVLRLIRFSLLLRLVPSIFGLMAGALRLDVRLFALGIVSTLPSVVALFFVVVLEQRSKAGNTPNIRQVRQLLGWTIVAYAIETVIPIIIVRMLLADGTLPAALESALVRNGEISLRRVLGAPLVFVLVPTVLGAWVDGRKGWFRWAGAAVLINLVSVGIVLAFDTLGPTLNTATDSAPIAISFRRQIEIGDFMAQSLVVIVVCYFVASLADQQRREHAQLEEASKALAQQAHVREQLAASRERMNLSRDLHDTVAHTLAALSVQVNAIGAVMAGEQAAARRELNVARELVKDGLENTRRAISGLRSAEVETFGLSGALQKQVEALAQRTSIQAQFEMDCREPTLSDEAANTLFRIAQEALNNVERHAQAQHAWVKLACGEREQAVLTIRDDGVGFDVSDLDDDSDDRDADRYGLRGMRERAELIGAHLRLDSVVGRGTTVTVSMK
jgi:signal transduction histidine kinase